MYSCEPAYIPVFTGFTVENKQVNMALDDDEFYKVKEAIKGDND